MYRKYVKKWCLLYQAMKEQHSPQNVRENQTYTHHFEVIHALKRLVPDITVMGILLRYNNGNGIAMKFEPWCPIYRYYVYLCKLVLLGSPVIFMLLIIKLISSWQPGNSSGIKWDSRGDSQDVWASIVVRFDVLRAWSKERVKLNDLGYHFSFMSSPKQKSWDLGQKIDFFVFGFRSQCFTTT